MDEPTINPTSQTTPRSTDVNNTASPTNPLSATTPNSPSLSNSNKHHHPSPTQESPSLEHEESSFFEFFFDPLPFEQLEHLVDEADFLSGGVGDGVTTAEEAENDADWEALDFKDLMPEAPDITALIQERIRKVITPKSILLRDKIAYVLGSLDLLVSAFWLGHSPQSFYRLFTIKAFLLLSIRWIIYRSKRWHYYLLDFCYLVQAMLVIQVWYFPANITFIKMVFAFSHGPLLWSILAFRNSLVYHSLDKVTSLFLHWFPALVCWAQRWYPSPELAAMLEASPEERARWEAVSMRDLCLLPMIPYIMWAVLYYLKIFVVSSSRISQRNYETLFAYVTSKKGLYSSLVLAAPRQLQPVVYMGLHLLMTLAATAFSAFFWKDQYIGLGFIVGAFGMAAWNGSCYYFDHFAHRYISHLGLTRKGEGGTPRPSSKDD